MGSNARKYERQPNGMWGTTREYRKKNLQGKRRNIDDHAIHDNIESHDDPRPWACKCRWCIVAQHHDDI